MIKRAADFLLSFGAYDGESETQATKRRIIVAAPG